MCLVCEESQSYFGELIPDPETKWDCFAFQIKSLVHVVGSMKCTLDTAATKHPIPVNTVIIHVYKMYISL